MAGAIGGYEVEGELGRGGFGRVLRARHRATGTVRAIKVLDHVAGPEEVERFRREGELMARLDGRGVVRVHEAAVERGRLYLVMDLMPGGSLRARVTPGRPWPWRDAAALVATLARALGAAHALGVVHRDLKPENVLFDEQGAPRVADFGCARDATARSLTETGVALGTPSYMAPEQLGGERVDARADVWALGVLLHELLAGERPFEARAPLELLRKLLDGERAPLERRLGVPPAVEAVLDRALSPGRDRRPADGEALARALDAACAAPATRGGARRPWLVGALGGALGAALVGALLAAAFAADRGSPPPSPSPPPARPAAPTPAADAARLVELAADPTVDGGRLERAAREALRLGNDGPAEDLARAADARPGCRPLATLAGVALLARGDRAAARARLAAGEPADAALAALVAETDALVEWLVASEVTLPLDIPAAPQGLGAALEQVARSPHASRIALVLSPLCALALDRVEVLHGVVDSPYGRSGWRTLGPLARERRLPAVLRGGLTLLAEVNDPRLRVGIGQEVGADQPLLAATLLATGASGESDERIRSLAQALELARAASEADAQPRWRARLIVAAAVDLARLQRKALSEVVLEADDARLRGATDLLVEAFLAGQDLPPDDGARARAAEALLEHVGSGHAPLAPVVDRLAALPGATPERTLVLASVRFASGGDDDPERLLADALARASAAESQVRAAAATAFTLRQFNAAVTRGAVATADLSRAMRLALTALDLATTPEARAPLAMTLGQAADLGLQGAPRLDLGGVALPPATTAEQAYARAVVLAAQGRVAQADEALAAARRSGRRPDNLDLLAERVVARARRLADR